jgi:hypothetical protein
MTGTPLLSTIRLSIYFVVLCSLVWKYRENKVVAFGVITLGFAALALLLGITPGIPDWITGFSVAVFLLMVMSMIPIVGYEIVRRRRARIKAADTLRDDISNPTINQTN